MIRPFLPMAFLLLAAISIHGCGGLSYQVDRDLLREVSVEHKLLLFEAENEVGIAFDEQEQIQRQIKDTRAEIAKAKALSVEAERDADRASDKNDGRAEQLALASREVLALKRDFLEARVTMLRKKLSAQDDLLQVALAKYELAKAKLVKKNNVEGAASLDLADFEEQVSKYVDAARASQATVSEYDKEAVVLRNAWQAARAKLEQSGGAGAASPWADDAAVWGAQ